MYYASDDDLADDEALGAWIDDLDERLPHGVRSVAGEGGDDDEPAWRPCSPPSCTSPRWSTRSPGAGSGTTSSGATSLRCACTRTAGASPVDVYQRLVNANFNLNVHRTMLLDDALPGLAIDAAGAEAFRELQQDLLGFQAELDRTSPAPWRMEPRRLKANINA